MHYRYLIFATLFITMSHAGHASSQTVDDGTAEKPSMEQDSARQDPDAQLPDANGTSTPRTAEPIAEASSRRSPYDYRSSEEISEDRSVSFPVDI